MMVAGADPLSWAGGVAALTAAAILLAGIGGLSTRTSPLRPWLAVLFGINAGRGDVTLDTLREIKPIDILLLLLAGVAFIGFWPGPATRQVPWMALAIGLPFAGILILVATGLWGRSGLMGGALVLSILMLLGDGLDRARISRDRRKRPSSRGRHGDDRTPVLGDGHPPRSRLPVARRLVPLDRGTAAHHGTVTPPTVVRGMRDPKRNGLALAPRRRFTCGSHPCRQDPR